MRSHIRGLFGLVCFTLQILLILSSSCTTAEEILAGRRAVAAAGTRFLRSTDENNSDAASTSANNRETPRAKVLILGAGISGVMSAKTLIDNKVTDILILDANDYVGGRMQSARFAQRVIELGASWIEGLNGNPILDLAQEVNLEMVPSDTDEWGIFHNEQQLMSLSDCKDVKERCAKAFAATEERQARYKEEKKQDISVAASLQYSEWFPNTPVENVVEYMMFDFFFAEPPSKSSMEMTINTPSSTEYGNEASFSVDQRGFNIIPRYILEKALQRGKELAESQGSRPPELLLNTKVEKIEYSDSGVTVITGNGRRFEAEYAICTFSVGVLKHKMHKLFSPPLPEWKTDEIVRFDMAVYTKIFLEFEENFWTKVTGGTQFSLYADDKIRGYYPVWQDLTLPRYGKDFQRPNSFIYFVTVTDAESRRIEMLSESQVKQEIMEVLHRMFGPDIPEPKSILVPKWYNNDLFYGSYSNWPIGMTTQNMKDLGAPVDNLFFSGEHTSAKFNGHLQGGYFSGVDTATALLEKMNAQ